MSLPHTYGSIVMHLALTGQRRSEVAPAKLMFDAKPGTYETVAQNLGHTGTKNAVSFYGGTDTTHCNFNSDATSRSSTALPQQIGPSKTGVPAAVEPLALRALSFFVGHFQFRR